MKDFIKSIRQKPEHTRKRIALGTSLGVTALVGIIWVTTLTTSGTFALAPANGIGSGVAPQHSAPVALTNTNVKSNFSQLAGAVGAAVSGSSTKPALTIVDGDTSSTIDSKPQTQTNSATVIPF